MSWWLEHGQCGELKCVRWLRLTLLGCAGVLLAIAAGVTLTIGAMWLTTVLPPVTSVSSEAVTASLMADVGGGSLPSRCRDRGSGVRECDVFDSVTSATVTYRVTMDSWRCWTAVRAERIGSLPDHASSCVHLSDQIRLVERT